MCEKGRKAMNVWPGRVWALIDGDEDEEEAWCRHCRTLDVMLKCEVITPLAGPVVPEEKHMNARRVVDSEGETVINGVGGVWVARYSAVGTDGRVEEVRPSAWIMVLREGQDLAAFVAVGRRLECAIRNFAVDVVSCDCSSSAVDAALTGDTVAPQPMMAKQMIA